MFKIYGLVYFEKDFQYVWDKIFKMDHVILVDDQGILQ